MTILMQKQPTIGIMQWFHMGERAQVEAFLQDVPYLGITHLRTGISWADWRSPGGTEWFEWLLQRLAEQLDVLPCLTFTPPSLSRNGKVNGPPHNLDDYALWVEQVLTEYGDLLEYVQLWNEPNGDAYWDFRKLDPNWLLFADMYSQAAGVVHAHGKRVVFGGMSPPDLRFVQVMHQHGVLQETDVLAVHGFPGTWCGGTWPGWDVVLTDLGRTLEECGHPDMPIWITEVGYSTYDPEQPERAREAGQVQCFLDVVDAGRAHAVERVYWYSWQDLDDKYPALIEANDVRARDEHEYSMGLRRRDGSPKLLHRVMHRVLQRVGASHDH